MGRFLLLAGVAFIVVIGVLPLPPDHAGASDAAPATVRLAPRSFEHRLDGEWTREGRPVDAPRETVKIRRPVDVMAFPVSVGDYAACVAATACAALTGPAGSSDLPVTGVNYQDATAYATWLSRRTGQVWRLPTDVEWAQAAGSRFVDDALGVDDDTRNPAVRWLARYEAETARGRTGDRELKPVGTLNVNELGVHDIAGPVWEWTSTCLRRVTTNAADKITASVETCGIYIVEGRHRAALTFFVRDPKSGGCSVGVPPDNVGFRLVREVAPSFLHRLTKWLSS